MSDELKRMAAEAAVAEIQDGMCLGLGTGSTAKWVIEGVGRLVAEGLALKAVATSEASAQQGRDLGIPLFDLDEIAPLDLAIDGADEIGPDLALIKGGGGAHFREKLVARAAKRFVVVADASKRVAVLGAFGVPLEISDYAAKTIVADVADAFRDQGLPAELSFRQKDGRWARSDNGHLLVDARCGEIADPAALAAALDRVPGLIEHGLFVNMAQRAYVASATGVDVFDA